jgi:diguanylate cyclase (GGDEF)-like protein
MKVTGPKGPTAPSRPERAVRAPSAGAAPIAAPVDPVSIAGIPEAELTPRVRTALVRLIEEVNALRRDLEATRARMAELEALADTDPMLGVLNRRAFVAQLNRAFAMVDRHGQPSCLVFVDVDDMKAINDGHGHGAGDAALAHIARVISLNIRQTDVLGRLGGDEFAIILANATLLVGAAKADMLATLISAEEFLPGLRVGVSCGVVEIVPGLTVEGALAAADRLMYERKRGK